MIKIIITDDIPLLCQGLTAILHQDTELQVIATASNGKEAYELCITYMPDIVLMDIEMPEYDGIYGIQQIKQHFPAIKVLVLTTFDDNDSIQHSLSAGADGYILKEMKDSKIINSIKCVHEGINVFGESIFQHMKSNIPTKKSQNIAFSLTPREESILKLIAQGNSNKEIATTLSLAEGTVKNALSRILEKLKLKDRTQLAIYALKNGLDT